tara:strand:- start:1137 stop:1574 length:438 start_codon:yes stop_codon:yes gene_type:complete
MASKRMSRKSMKGRGKKSCGGKRTKRKGKKKRGGGLFDNMPGKKVKKGIKTVEKIPGEAVSLTEKGLDTGVGVVEDIGKVGLKVGKTAEKLSKRGLKKLTGKKKGKSKKSSYRAFLSKELKRVKKANPSWPQSKVFKEAVKAWKK